MISHTFKCIFVHIPKCGGTSIEKIIWPEPRLESDLWMGFKSKYHNKYQTGGLQHLFANQIRQEVGEQVFKTYFKFSIVRNPWEKTISQYFYMKNRPDLREWIGMEENSSFETYLDLIRKKAHVQWEPQYKFIYDQNGDLLIDFIGRLENFDKDASSIINRIGIKAEIPHSNATKHKHYTEYYNQETIEIVNDMYSNDISLLNYKFN
jgi:hypothetical protein